MLTHQYCRMALWLPSLAQVTRYVWNSRALGTTWAKPCTAMTCVRGSPWQLPDAHHVICRGRAKGRVPSQHDKGCGAPWAHVHTAQAGLNWFLLAQDRH